MCNESGTAFARKHLSEDGVHGKRVLEVGSRDVNGSLRSTVEAYGPSQYVGVDIMPGPGVDELCDVNDLHERYGRESFDVVISTELVEHVKDWRGAINNMKLVLKPGGDLLITTRSRGFKVHGYPWDYWRYEPSDMQKILADFERVEIETDDQAPGVFVKGQKPRTFRRQPLEGIALYSVVTRRRSLSISIPAEWLFKLRHRAHLLYRWLLPEAVRAPLKRFLTRGAGRRAA
jgi:SAM-dependent methyltransferase